MQCAKLLGLEDTVLYGRTLLMQANARSTVLAADASLQQPTPVPQGVARHWLVENSSGPANVALARRRAAPHRRTPRAANRPPSSCTRSTRSGASIAVINRAATISNACRRTARSVVLGPGEDAGILHLGEHDGERYGVVIAHESHNHPSQVVPFEGAATGIGGIVRDVLCMGAEVIAVADPLRFGRVEDPALAPALRRRRRGRWNRRVRERDRRSESRGRRLFRRAVSTTIVWSTSSRSESSKSRRSSIRTPRQAPRAGTSCSSEKRPIRADSVARRFRRCTLDAQDEEANKGAVQVPDPFLKNVLMRASYRVFELLRERGIAAGIQRSRRRRNHGLLGGDRGGRRIRRGASISTRSTSPSMGMAPEVIAVGETQERLLWALPPDVTADVLRIYNEEFTLPQVAHNARAGDRRAR